MDAFTPLTELKEFDINQYNVAPGSVIAIIGNNDELAQRVLLDLCWALRNQHRFAKVFCRRLQNTEFYRSIVPAPWIHHDNTLQDDVMREEFQKWFKYHRKQFKIHGKKISSLLFLDEVVIDGDKNNKQTHALYDQLFEIKDLGITTIIRAQDGITGIPSPLKSLVDFTFILNNSADIPKIQKKYAFMFSEKPQLFASLIAACHSLQCLVIERAPKETDNIINWLNHIKQYASEQRREVGEAKLCSSKLWNYTVKPAAPMINADLNMFSRLMINCAKTTGKKLTLRASKMD